LRDAFNHRLNEEAAMTLVLRLSTAVLGLALAVGLGLLPMLPAADAAKQIIPRYEVDPFWPKPLPDRWVTGEIGGTCVDQRDHVFIVTRRNLTAREMLVATPSPAVIEFDPEGNVVNSWGDPVLLPSTMHGCYVDHENNVWLSGNSDGIVQKYSHDGSRLLLQIGVKGLCDSVTRACGETNDLNSSQTLLNGPANVSVDPANGDIYIADGYGNHRVVVFDKTGRFLRQWGSTGTGPGQFGATGGGHPHCVVQSPEGLLYVCDRPNHRIQVFDKMGNLQRILSEPGTPREATIGSANDLVFPKEKRPTLMFTAGRAEVVWTVDHATEMILAGFGRPGQMAGDFTTLHSMAIDSKGNIYTGETIDGGRRVQKFTPRGKMQENDFGEPFMGHPHYDPLPN
jgi:DNA-binding beta-propeller fold protein YncE